MEPCKCLAYVEETVDPPGGYQHVHCNVCQNRRYVTRKSYTEALNAYMMAILRRRDQELDAAGRFTPEELKLLDGL